MKLLDPVSERIIGCAFRVANALGHGFVEKIDENALAGEPLCLLITFGRPKVEIRRKPIGVGSRH